MRRIVLCLALAALFAIGPGTCPAGEKLVVASGAGYKKMVRDLADAFTAKTGIKVERMYGNMGQTIARARNSGMVDCVVGDRKFLEKSDLEFSAMHEIGRGKLVAVAAKGVHLDDPADIASKAITRVAHPDPKKAIYGRAANEYLRRAGLYGEVRPKLLVVATVPQVSAYVLGGEVDVGFINMTDALGIRDKVGKVLPVEQRYYTPIVIVAGALSSAPAPDALEAFARFLSTDQARAIARAHGL